MYKPYRASLKSLWREFKRAAEQYPGLFHQRFVDPMLVGPGLISEEAFLAFQNAYPLTAAEEWVRWERTPDGSYWGRFHGNPNGLDEFERLAESAYLVLREFDASLVEEHGHHGWLNTIHDMASNSPTPLLRTRYGVWGVEAQPDSEHFDQVVTRWAQAEAFGGQYRPHPFFYLLVHNVFTSSMSAIELLLDPDMALLVGDDLRSDLPVMPDEPLLKIKEDPSPQVPNTSAHQDSLSQSEPTRAAGVLGAPIVAISFDGNMWVFQYEFAGQREEWLSTSSRIGFALYKAMLSRDGSHPMSSLTLEKEAGVHHPGLFLSSTGVADGDSDDRHARLDGDDDEVSFRPGSASKELTIDAEGLAAIDKKLASLKKERDACCNPERREEIEQQMMRIEDRRSKSVNRRSKPRTIVCGEEEKARKRVNNALANARLTLSVKMPRFAWYLQTAVKFRSGWTYDSQRATGSFTRAQIPKS